MGRACSIISLQKLTVDVTPVDHPGRREHGSEDRSHPSARQTPSILNRPERVLSLVILRTSYITRWLVEWAGSLGTERPIVETFEYRPGFGVLFVGAVSYPL